MTSATIKVSLSHLIRMLIASADGFKPARDVFISDPAAFRYSLLFVEMNLSTLIAKLQAYFLHIMHDFMHPIIFDGVSSYINGMPESIRFPLLKQRKPHPHIASHIPLPAPMQRRPLRRCQPEEDSRPYSRLWYIAEIPASSSPPCRPEPR